MKDHLATYLADHLAGAEFALELLKSMRDQQQDPELSSLASGLHAEIEADRTLLGSLAKAVGDGHSPAKDALAWVAEKASRLKLRRDSAQAFGVFESLETLALGILGKLSLWNALAVVSTAESRLRGPDYEALARRAQAQHALVEQARLQWAAVALTQPAAASA
jgi:hypothetical protein